MAPTGVYPRGCGGTRVYTRSARSMKGLSPRVRGNRRPGRLSSPGAGSIPAGAGEPVDDECDGEVAGVYPRGCGGTIGHTLANALVQGLSPRVRGNQLPVRQRFALLRSIPAGAGEPLRCAWPIRLSRVYPRGCGGTLLGDDAGVGGQGLSPRVRGNPDRILVGRAGKRSIPAGAGEPDRSRADPRRRRVYPRGCGGTSGRTRGASGTWGLSPRVRGNQP